MAEDRPQGEGMTERYCSVCSLQITDAEDPDRVGYHPGRCNDDTGRMSSMGPVPDQAFYGAVLEMERDAERVRTLYTETHEAVENVQALPEAIRAPAVDGPVLLRQVSSSVCTREGCGKPSAGRMYCSGACKVASHRERVKA